MAKKVQKLKPDIVLKNYWRNNEQFSDLFNAVLFEGRQVIRPEELEDVDTEESSVLENKGYIESIQASRDNAKIRKKSTEHGAEFVILGIEGEEHIHYAMPMRVMGYDYGIYKKQYDSNAQRYKTADGINADEYISRMKKTDKFIPVITIVIYYGERVWDGATSLHGMLDISDEISKYVNDYKMLLVEARKNDLMLHNANNVDLFPRATSQVAALVRIFGDCREGQYPVACSGVVDLIYWKLFWTGVFQRMKRRKKPYNIAKNIKQTEM